MKSQLPHDKIKHVVVLMLENRGFDHLLGWLYDDKANRPQSFFGNAKDRRDFLGLSTLSAEQLQALANPFPSPETPPALPRKGARAPKTPAYNPGESFTHIMNQMWGTGLEAADWKDPETRQKLIDKLSQQGSKPAPMTGYILDFDQDVYHQTGKRLGGAELSEIMDTYAPEQLPVLSGLARYYGLSDEWYCSVPSQTNTNRAFSMAGTSRGLVTNSFYDAFASTINPLQYGFNKASGGSHADALPASTRSLFEVLSQFDIGWTVYWQDNWPPKDISLGRQYQYVKTMFPQLADPSYQKNFVQFDSDDPGNAFFTAARQGRLPAVSWVEPKWGGGAQWDTIKRAVGNDYHPVSDTTVGEDFLMNVYTAIADSPSWKDTLLIVTFDENGGTYDHLVPPAASPSFNDRVPLGPDAVGKQDMDAATRTQFGFTFDQFGIRVPTLLISPRIAPSSIFRSPQPTPFDHTSIIATVLSMAGIGRQYWLMGERVAQAPTFDSVLLDVPREIARPAEALNIPTQLYRRDARDDDDRPPLLYEQKYLVRYIGDPWYAQSGARYLSVSQSIKGLWYPTLTDNPAKAVCFQLSSPGCDPAYGPVANMSKLLLVTTESAWIGLKLLCADPVVSCVYYGRDPQYGGCQWQIRMLSSRDPQRTVREGDWVYFLSQLQPAAYQSVSARTTPDPLQRLLPYPDDPNYLSTRGGEWALWQLLAAGDVNNV